MKNVHILKSEEFQKEVTGNSGIIIIDYFADWCQPCKMLAPVLEKVSEQMKNVKFFKINVDDSQELAQQQGILGIPCIVIYNNGEEAERIVGFQGEDQLKKKLMSVLP